MDTEQFPGIDEPTSRDRLAAELADEQLRLIFGLRQIRIDRGMSITEVAEAMGVDPAQVSRFESGGTNPTMVTIRRYAKTVEALVRIDTCEWVDRVEGGRGGDRIHWAMPTDLGLKVVLESMFRNHRIHQCHTNEVESAREITKMWTAAVAENPQSNVIDITRRRQNRDGGQAESQRVPVYG